MASARRRLRECRGFTLVEVLLTLAIVGMLMTSLLGVFTATIRTKQRVESGRTLYDVGPIILDMLERDVASTYFYDLNGDSAVVGRNRTVSGMDADRIDLVTSSDSTRFLEVGHDLRPTDFTKIGYAARANPKEPGFLMLYRREDTFAEGGDSTTTQRARYALVYDRVKTFNLSYYSGSPDDPVEGVPDWDAVSDGVLPAAIRVELEVGFTSQAGLVLGPTAPETLKYSRLLMLPPGATEDLSDVEPLASDLDSIDAGSGQTEGEGGRGNRNRQNRGQGRNNANDSGVEDLFGGR